MLGLSIRALARKHRVHRRAVRQALMSAVPPPRKAPEREAPVLTPELRAVVVGWLEADRTAPRKQRHTARRVYQRLKAEYGFAGAESTVRKFVRGCRRRLAQASELSIPREHEPGQEAEVDFWEAYVDFPDGRRRVQIFAMRACYSGREFQMAFPLKDQQAFLEGHVEAFAHFGGVFKVIRYDNLKSAVVKILRGRRREESDRFVALRSHYLHDSEFCVPGKGGAHEKGGVEGALGRFRRGHLVPVPSVASFEELNRFLVARMEEDDQRRLEGRERSIIEDWLQEERRLQPLPAEPFSACRVGSYWVDGKSRICVATNRYSVPVSLTDRKVEARLGALRVEVFSRGRLVAVHERIQGRHQEKLKLDHYLELLEVKPGALAGSRPLHQARQAGLWPAAYDELWSKLRIRHGDWEGTRRMVEALYLHRQASREDVRLAVELTLSYGICEPAAIAMVLRQLKTAQPSQKPLEDLGALGRYGSPPGTSRAYDGLLPWRLVESAA